MSYEQPAALHKSKLEPYRSSEFIASVHMFEPGLGTTSIIPAGGCSPNDLQMHIISSRVALVKMMSVMIGVKIQCYLFVHRWSELMIAW